MDLVIVRHGIAVDIGEKGVTNDADRLLSAEGVEKTRRAAEGLRELECRPDAIFSSPLVRAQQTARVIADVLARGLEVTVSPWLSPGEPVQEAGRELGHCPGRSLLLVGHMPDVARLASWMLALNGSIDMEFGKAAACRIAFERKISPGAGTLEWLLPPRVLRALARNRSDAS